MPVADVKTVLAAPVAPARNALIAAHHANWVEFVGPPDGVSDPL
jgi:hypothetical protein